MSDSRSGSQTPPRQHQQVPMQPPAALTGNSPTTEEQPGLIKPLNPSAISFDVRRTPPPQDEFGGATANSSSSTGWTVDEGGPNPPSSSGVGAGGIVGTFAGHHVHHHFDEIGFQYHHHHHHHHFPPLHHHHHLSPHHHPPQHLPQHQPPHVTAAAAEREFLATRSMIQHVSRPALVAVLTSLLDDFPHLAPMVRYRCDRAMAAVASQHQSQQFGGGGWPPQDPFAVTAATTSPPGAVTPPSQRRSSGPPSQPQRTHSGSNFHGGSAVSHNNSATPSSVRHRANVEDDHVELCSTHGNMRALKHLSYRATTGTYECIPGFHCLETSSPPSHSVTPKKEPYTLTPPRPLQVVVEGAAAASPQTPPPLPLMPVAPPLEFTTSGEELDVARLQDLLQTVRQVRLGEDTAPPPA